MFGIELFISVFFIVYRKTDEKICPENDPFKLDIAILVKLDISERYFERMEKCQYF